MSHRHVRTLAFAGALLAPSALAQPAPGAAIAVQRRLIDRGFTAELSTAGTIQGVSQHFGLGLTIEVTRALRR